MRFVDVEIEAQASFEQAHDPDENAFLYVESGKVVVAGQSAHDGQIVRTENDGDVFTVTAGSRGARFFVFSGRPLMEPVGSQGPFVAESRAALDRLQEEYRTGRMGKFDPIDSPASAT